MRRLRIPAVLLFGAVLSAAWIVFAQPAGKPGEGKAKLVPLDVLQGLHEQLRPTGRPRSEAEFLKIIEAPAGKVLERGAKLEAEYAGASNLFRVRIVMLRAADFRDRVNRSPERTRQVLNIAGRLLTAEAPAAVKLWADATATRRRAIGPKGKPSEDAEKQIRAMLLRHPKSPAGATRYAAVLADDAGLQKLHEELLGLLETKYATDGNVLQYLLEQGRKVKFRADLTKLDGTKLTLPDDLLGKVVVIDFWATWCGPCRQSLPHMKKTYAAYKDKGVEFVGISLDRPGMKAGLKAFIKDGGLDWIHTYSGKMWDDPTARKYGISGIPAIWVVGRDGNVVSQNARADLEATIAKALKTPTTRPEPAGEKGTK